MNDFTYAEYCLFGILYNLFIWMAIVALLSCKYMEKIERTLKYQILAVLFLAPVTGFILFTFYKDH